MTEYRVIRVPLPTHLLKAIDRLVDTGAAGYSSRAELIRDAVEAMVLEVTYGVDGEPHQRADVSGTAGLTSPDDSASQPEQQRVKHGVADMGGVSSALSSLRAASMLGPCPPCAIVTDGKAVVSDDRLFGLHNRDYPTLWAAQKVAELTCVAPVPVDDFYRVVAQSAWDFGERLAAFETRGGQKLTALFPTNRSKPESSEGAFLNFAVGSHRRVEGEITARGPLYLWRLCQLVSDGDRLLIGLTHHGVELLESLAELTVEAPHGSELAERFLGYLRRYAPQDWQGFEETVAFLAAGTSRRGLVEAMAAAHSDWTETVAATNAAGYVARGREWGLIAPNQADGKYVLTEVGVKFLESTKEIEHVDN
jgi:Arc/MetJ-type ribon-helix-helix transcriptional regulator